MTAARLLIVNADDFGFTRDVNAGIVEAHQRGILNATTLMANGKAFDDAVRLARQNPALDVGCHLVLVGGPSLLSAQDALPKSVAGLLAAISARRVRVYDELAAQVRRMLDAGLAPTHLDTHKHTHLLPPVLDAVARIAQEFRIPWVRRPFDLPLSHRAPWKRRLASSLLRVPARRAGVVLASRGCRSTDHFAGFEMTGRVDTPTLTLLLRQLPPGITELMCHPGRCGDELRAARTRLKESRERELEALVAPETRRAIEESGIRLVTYRDL